MVTTYKINYRQNRDKKMYWLTSRNSILSIENKLKSYKTIIKPIWTYRIPLWEIAAAVSHINKLATMQDTENNSQRSMVCQKRGYTQT